MSRDARFLRKKQAVRLGGDEVMLIAVEDRESIRARLDDGYMPVVGGYGGWEDVERPGQVSATIFRGASSQQLPLRLILGGWPRHGRASSCERAIAFLERHGRQSVDAARGDAPPLLRVRGRVPHDREEWFIADVDWGEIDVFRGRRVRAFVTVTLQRHVGIQFVAKRRSARDLATRRAVNPRDTLRRIAKDEYDLRKDAEITRAANVLKRFNDLRDPNRLRKRRYILIPRNWKALAEGRRR